MAILGHREMAFLETSVMTKKRSNEFCLIWGVQISLSVSLKGHKPSPPPTNSLPSSAHSPTPSLPHSLAIQVLYTSPCGSSRAFLEE